jgi:hypothetical protein
VFANLAVWFDSVTDTNRVFRIEFDPQSNAVRTNACQFDRTELRFTDTKRVFVKSGPSSDRFVGANACHLGSLHLLIRHREGLS